LLSHFLSFGYHIMVDFKSALVFKILLKLEQINDTRVIKILCFFF